MPLDKMSSSIGTCNFIYSHRLLKKANEAKYFAVFVEKTADLYGMEPFFNYCARYVNIETSKFHKGFLQFVPTFNLNKKATINTI